MRLRHSCANRATGSSDCPAGHRRTGRSWLPDPEAKNVHPWREAHPDNSLAFTVFYLVDFFWVSGSFVSATVHLVLALMVVRLFSAHRDRDYVFLAILSFLAVLAASVLTV